MIESRISVPNLDQTERLRVMIIDDSEIVRCTLRDKLEGAGYEVVELSSAIGASREILRRKVQVVLLDVSMPGLSGDRFVSVLRNTPRLEELAIVIVSGETEARLAELRRNTAADGVLSKSQIESDLLPLLTRLLRRSASGVQSRR
jgi:CheY-like chemotaxis protein